jgi:hypothetical protein
VNSSFSAFIPQPLLLLNPFNLTRFTHSIQSSNGPTRRYDYIFPNPLLHPNLQSAQVFRTDLLNPLPPTLNTTDSATASDHLPVQIVFNHPFVQPFHITSIVRSNQSVTLTWESVPGQSYAVESAASLGVSNGWSVMAANLLATNDVFNWSTNGALEANFFRVKRGS